MRLPRHNDDIDAREASARRVEPGLLQRLKEAVGAQHVIVDDDVMASYAQDWTGRFRGAASAVVRPGDSSEVAKVVLLCRDAGVAIVPQGGNTGLVGGGVPLHGELVLSLARLTRIFDVDQVGGQLTADAGASVASVQEAARAAGWAYGIDLGSRDSATVGGTVATNAGGLQVLRHGNTRAQLLGVEAVLGTGAVVAHLGGLLKDNTGYDIGGLLCGSEGTLGVVTAVRLRLVPPNPERVVTLLGFASTIAAVDAGFLLRRSLPELQSLEFFLQAGLELVCRVGHLSPPFATEHRAYLLAEVAGQHDPLPALGEVLASLPWVEDAAVATEPARQGQLWRYREAHTEAINGLGAPHKLDVTLPARELAAFIEAVPDVVRARNRRAATWLFGHVADGNVHVNITGVDPDDLGVDDAVLLLAAEMGGSISAEHGIGSAKRAWLHLNRSETEMEAFRSIKDALDPAGILNPHVLFPTRDMQ